MGSQEAIDRIVDYARAFSHGVARSHAAPFNAADFEDAYNRLSRLRDRYLKDKSSLDLSEQQALAKVFEDDKFIEGMLNIRPVGGARSAPNRGHPPNNKQCAHSSLC